MNYLKIPTNFLKSKTESKFWYLWGQNKKSSQGFLLDLI